MTDLEVVSDGNSIALPCKLFQCFCITLREKSRKFQEKNKVILLTTK